MFRRVREIADPFGSVICISVEPHPNGALVVVDRPARHGLNAHHKVMLDAYGADILLGFIMSARLAVPGDMPEEIIAGAFPARFRLVNKPAALVVIDQLNQPGSLRLPETLWDRLYAELCLVCAHARELERRSAALIH